MSTTLRKFTPEDLYTRADGDRGYELVRGEILRLAEPDFSHNLVAYRLLTVLGAYVESHDLGVVNPEQHFVLRPDTVRAPDIAFFHNDRIPPGAASQRGYPTFTPDLCVEIISPRNRPAEIAEKVRDYIAVGVQLVWVVDARARTVVVHRSGAEPVTLTEDDALSGQDVVPGFAMSVRGIFATVRRYG